MHLGIIVKIVYNTTAQPKCLNLCNAFYGRQFVKLGEYSRVLLVQVFAIDCSNA